MGVGDAVGDALLLAVGVGVGEFPIGWKVGDGVGIGLNNLAAGVLQGHGVPVGIGAAGLVGRI